MAETAEYLRAAQEVGLSQVEMWRIVEGVGANPDAGEVIQGTGGFRKLRLAGRGKGKSGGYRLITFFSGPELPVFLITIFSKGEKADLTRAERNELAKIGEQIVSGYRRG